VTQPTDGAEPRGTGAPHPDDISGVDNWVEEGGPLEPADVVDVEQSTAHRFGSAAAEMAHETEVEEADPVAQQLAERTADLQRLQAEYLNYKRRVERDRELVRENATYAVLSSMLPVLDDIDRAREHGELEGGFKAVAESLERIVAGLGLSKYGEKGEPFDPNLHEALMHGHSPDVTTTTVEHLAQAGYRIGDRVVRAAKVTVLDPE
jgi:molecular chaperone GrpE